MKHSWKSYAASASDVAWTLVLAILISLCTVSRCEADELPDVSGECAPEVEGTRRAIVVHEGVHGVWFERNVTLCMAGRLALLPLFANRIRLLEQRLQLGEERHELMVRQVAVAAEAEQRAVDALGAAVGLRREAESRAARERSLRWLWAAVGVFVTGSAFALSVWGYNRLESSSP